MGGKKAPAPSRAFGRIARLAATRAQGHPPLPPPIARTQCPQAVAGLDAGGELGLGREGWGGMGPCARARAPRGRALFFLPPSPRTSRYVGLPFNPRVRRVGVTVTANAFAGAPGGASITTVTSSSVCPQE